MFTRNDEEYMLLFGGLTWDLFSTYNLQEQLGDLWVYSIKSKTWLPVYANSDFNPDKRYGSTLKYIGDSKFLLYGGINSDQVFSDLWSFNMDSNMWTQISRVNPVLNEDDWPRPVKFPSLVLFKRGLILYGGSFYVSINERNSESTIFVRTGRSNYILNDLWILYSDICPKDCSGNGLCNYGRCICNQNYFEEACEIKKCSGSFCFTDLDIFVSQNCYHCSNHGKCDGEKCICDKGWVGDDCSIQDCPGDCSAKENPEIGTCIEVKPISQCVCNEKLKRGGDDCSVIFCFNDCGSTGKCDMTKGVCKCDEFYNGLDCSVFVPEFRSSRGSFIRRLAVGIMMLVVMCIL